MTPDGNGRFRRAEAPTDIVFLLPHGFAASS
jgi:hypothetical protein